MRHTIRIAPFASALLLAACVGLEATGPATAPPGGGASAAPSTPALRAAPRALRFDSSSNGWPPAQVVAVEGVGPGVLPPVDVSVSLAEGGGWLRVTPGGAGNTQFLTVQATPSNLRPGTYHGELLVSAAGATASPVRVAVALTALAASGSRCPPGSTLAWKGGGGGAAPADFASSFHARYCTSCHHSARVGDDRSGAPPIVNLDTLEGARRAPYVLDLAAAAGPAGTRAFMPPEGPAPSLAERTWLGQWIACGQP